MNDKNKIIKDLKKINKKLQKVKNRLPKLPRGPFPINIRFKTQANREMYKLEIIYQKLKIKCHLIKSRHNI
jgi:hypothetical protein